MKNYTLVFAVLVLLFSAQVCAKKTLSQKKVTDQTFTEAQLKETTFVETKWSYITGYAFEKDFYPYVSEGKKACNYYGQFYWKDQNYSFNESRNNNRCYHECQCNGRRICNRDYYCTGSV